MSVPLLISMGGRRVPGIRTQRTHYLYSRTASPGHSSNAPPKDHINADEDCLLLQRISQSDTTAFWILWQRHSAYLSTICMRITHGNRDDAEDIMSEVCVRLAEEMPRHAANIRNIRSWFARSMINAMVDHYRRNGRRILSIGSSDDIAKIADSKGPEVRTPEDKLIAREAVFCTLQKCNALPPRLRLVVNLRFIKDKSYADIARHLGISEALVRKRIQEARTILRKNELPF